MGGGGYQSAASARLAGSATPTNGIAGRQGQAPIPRQRRANS
jgi:hypothetical protein